MKPNKFHVINALRTYRNDNPHITVEDIANNLGYSIRTVEKWFQGVTTPSRGRLKKISTILNLDFNYLVGANSIDSRIYSKYLQLDTLVYLHDTALKFGSTDCDLFLSMIVGFVHGKLVEQNYRCKLVYEVQTEPVIELYEYDVELIFVTGANGILLHVETKTPQQKSPMSFKSKLTEEFFKHILKSLEKSKLKS